MPPRIVLLPVIALLILATLLPLASPATTSPIFQTTITGSYQSGTKVLSASSPTTSGSLSSQTTTITYANSYFTTPSFGYGISYISAGWSQTTTVIETIIDVSSSSGTTTAQTLLLSFTTSTVNNFRIHYLVCLPNSFFFLDVRNSYQDLSTDGSIFTSSSPSSRQKTLTIPYKAKSNSSNAVVVYNTVGLSMLRQSNTFEYTLSTTGRAATTFNLQLTVMANNGMRFIRLVVYNYQNSLHVISAPLYVDMGFSAGLTGSVTDSSGFGLSTTGTIMIGLTDWALTDSNAAIDFDLTMSTLSYSITSTSATRVQVGYVWYRQKTCPVYYYQLNSNTCDACDYTCTTCTSSTNVTCSTCQASSFRTFDSGTNSCPCNTNYRDVSVRICQQIICPSYCTVCSTDNVCTGCQPSMYRTLDNSGNCVCASYTIDFSNVGLDNCQACYPTCLTCSSLLSATACLTCNLDRDHRIFLASNSTCPCVDGYYEVSNLATVFANYIYVGVPCPKCEYTCETCSSSAACLTCNSTVFRQMNATSGFCSCMTGYFDDGINQTCSSCAYSCATCTSTNVCTTCPGTRNISGTTCPCDANYFDAGVATCQSCHYSCLTCDNSTACSSCSTTYFRTMGTNFLCDCLTGYYDISGVLNCGVCDLTCLTCVAGNNNNCTSCNPSNGRQLTASSTCVCTIGYYQNSPVLATCILCYYTCQSCSDGSTCNTCNASNYRQISSNACICMDKYYDDGGNQLCASCGYRCLTCTNSTSCSSCDATTRNTTDLANCVCLTGFYDNGVSSSCLPCHSTCLECTNPNNCTSCVTNRYLTTSQTCLCVDRTFEPLCQACHYSCLTCITSNITCQSCNGTAFRLYNSAANTCNCYTSYYDDGSNQLCQPCHFSCATCLDALSCSSCPVNRESNGSYCACLSAFYQNSVNLNCLACHYSCATCDSYSNCTSCNASLSRTSSNTSSTCICSDGFYDNGANQICFACDVSCQTCSSFSVCLTCLASNFRTLNSSTCPCDGRYYDDGTALCKSCHYSCLTCTGPSSCLTCDFSKNRTYITGPYCSCQGGYFDTTSVQQCSTCDYTCLTCQSSAAHCLSCDTTTRNFISASFSCPCKDGYYDPNAVTCLSCHYSCATCSNATQCLSCPSTRTRNSLFQCICDPGYYEVVNQSLCSSCSPQCKQCTDFHTCTICDTSVNFREFTNSTCSCPVGYYDPAPTNYICQLCQYSCQDCNTANQCTLCNINYQRTYNSGTLLCSCADGYFDDGSNQPCIACPYDCLTCLNATTCLTCHSTRSLSSINRCNCNSSFFLNGTICQSCPVECTTCNSSSICTSCVSPRLLQADACVCPDKFYSVAGTATCNACEYSCATCVSPTQCSSCNSTMNRYLTSTYCLCSLTFFDDGTNQQCQSCHYSCLLCNQASVCLSCDATKNRIYNSTSQLCECASGYYQDPSTLLCIQCSYSCLTCTSSTACSSCNPTYQRVLNTTTFTCDCPTQYYYDTLVSVVCASCDYTCLSCSSNAHTCTSCLNTTFRSLSASNCTCLDGYYDVANQAICQACSYTCVTCTGTSTNCTLCSSANYRSTIPSCPCFDGYYDGGSAVCSTCFYSCQTCTNGLTCSSCNLTADFRQHNTITQMCDCIASYYDIGTNTSVCQACTYSCQTCQHPSECLTCPATRALSVTSCLCQAKYYDDGSSLLCIGCNYTCQTCANGTSCLSCNSANFREFNSSTFLCSCMAKYYDNGVELCISCDPSCATCDSASACLTCPLNINKTINSSIGGYCVCYFGFYQNTTAGALLGYNSVCQPCDFTCMTCDLLSTNCTTCNSTANRFLNNTNECPCQSGFFQVAGQEQCLPCYTNCLTCYGTLVSNCYTCDSTTYYLNNTCYTTCPSYYANVTSPSRQCVSCPSNCLSCPNSTTVCQVCASPYFIFIYNSSSALCITECPAGYYLIGQTCYLCSSPCSNCSAQLTCLSCISLFYLSNSFCYQCHATCLSCTGSTALDCTTCISNYLLLNGVCQKLLCTDTQYVHSTQGCLQCISAFPNSLTCLSTGASTCQSGYLLSSNQCVACSNVTGYIYDSTTGNCKDRCGDGIIITSLCDDGNTFNGDGCSSVCNIEQGWTCTNNSCDLTNPPVISLVSMRNFPANHTIVLVVGLNVGVRLIKGNFILTWTSLTNYQYEVYALNAWYTQYQLVINYFQDAQNQQLSINVVSPIVRRLQSFTDNTLPARLMQTTSVSITLSLTVNVNIQTHPPAIYVSDSQARIYTTYLMWFLAIVHILIIFAIIAILYMKLKVMLLVVDALNAITILYIVSGIGLYGATLLAQQSSRGLQPFVYPFGILFQNETTNFFYFNFNSNIFSSCVVQFVVAVFCLAMNLCYSPQEGEDNVWPYYRMGFIFAFAFDFMLSAFSIFIWGKYHSYQSTYSSTIAALMIIWLLCQMVGYYRSAQTVVVSVKKVVPAVSFITNQVDMVEKSKIDGHIFDHDLSKQKKGYKMEYQRQSDQKTQELDGGQLEQSSSSGQDIKYYDFVPSSQTHYSLLHSNHITKMYLPLMSIIFALLFGSLTNIQTPSLRCGILFGLTLLYFICLIITKNETIKAVRMIKLFVLALIYIFIAILGLVASAGYNSIDLKSLDGVIVTFVCVGMLWNFICLLVNVYKSEAFREYLIAKKNQEIMERNKRHNQTRQKIYKKQEQNVSKLRKTSSEQPSSSIPVIFDPEIQISEEPVQDKEMNLKISNLKKKKVVDSRTMVMQIDQEVSDVREENMDYRKQFLDQKNIFQSRVEGNSQGSRMKNINNSQMSMMRLADTPHEEKRRRKGGRRSQEKEEIAAVEAKKKKKKKVEEPPRQLEQKEDSFNLEDMLDDMDMPRGFKIEEQEKHEGRPARMLEMDEISSIKEQRQQFMQQNLSGEMSVFNKILSDYKKYRDNKGVKGKQRK